MTLLKVLPVFLLLLVFIQAVQWGVDTQGNTFRPGKAPGIIYHIFGEYTSQQQTFNDNPIYYGKPAWGDTVVQA